MCSVSLKEAPGKASTRSASKQPAKGNAEISGALYQRTNGFLLGCFLSLIRFRFARAEFGQHRRRIAEFLHEIGAEVDLPATQRAYDAVSDELLTAVVKACAARSREIADFALLGGVCCIDASMRLAGTVESDQLRDLAVATMHKHRIDRPDAAYERFLAQVHDAHAERQRPGVHIDHFLSPALDLLTRLIEPLQPDRRCAFIAMPFRAPYAGYYATLYRPLARALNCSAFRMWGGLSGEAYVDLMLAVIRRCGRVIADLSGLNANVVYEVGVARGLDKPVVLLTQRRLAKATPANIGSDQLLLLYSPREKDWPHATALRCAAQVSIIELARSNARQRLARGRRRPGEALPRPAGDDLMRSMRRVERNEARASKEQRQADAARVRLDGPKNE